MDANPVLVEVVRGNWVENRHRGAFVVTDADGTIIASAGDIDRPIFPRWPSSTATRSRNSITHPKSWRWPVPPIMVRTTM